MSAQSAVSARLCLGRSTRVSTVRKPTNAARVSMFGAAPRQCLSKMAPASRFSQRRYYAAKTVQEQIADQIKANKVVVYMKGTPNAPMCGFSRQVADVLKRSGAEFTAYNVLESEAVRSGIKEFTSWPTIPQVFIKGEFVGGCDIVTEMYRDGSLQTALEDAGAIKKKAAPAS